MLFICERNLPILLHMLDETDASLQWTAKPPQSYTTQDLTLLLAYKEITDTSKMGNDDMHEEMETRLLDISKNCTTFTP